MACLAFAVLEIGLICICSGTWAKEMPESFQLNAGTRAKSWHQSCLRKISQGDSRNRDQMLRALSSWPDGLLPGTRWLRSRRNSKHDEQQSW
ncbi:hypothetical protein HBI56_115270 [Parastagonospora nodorum]|uniref:Secreted protein n=1 Tax=Phaeosphaeria nodorum (strain SN15 / ATCC MYA-4574 / FGSC 10173) TaxID=321614 RepID=A0A7U2I3N2_PHANO|nr:hypothetical protein HBH56_196130 [Parastagonospora nodorum]QRD00590.1 hypothetical protein JI435_091470 [Parastagonospora nodorum SN15]KAH3924944.1 hypothetical protein HBH54_187360 [Parastagonospora nodorum]KAH3952981.1 hypothetical protein HBH53_039510 [Parastagonospora nodorum]KAH3976536.1 hypothetical protein HBH52_118980 [Parastagonospora nodorum]